MNTEPQVGDPRQLLKFLRYHMKERMGIGSLPAYHVFSALVVASNEEADRGLASYDFTDSPLVDTVIEALGNKAFTPLRKSTIFLVFRHMRVFWGSSTPGGEGYVREPPSSKVSQKPRHSPIPQTNYGIPRIISFLWLAMLWMRYHDLSTGVREQLKEETRRVATGGSSHDLQSYVTLFDSYLTNLEAQIEKFDSLDEAVSPR